MTIIAIDHYRSRKQQCFRSFKTFFMSYFPPNLFFAEGFTNRPFFRGFLCMKVRVFFTYSLVPETVAAPLKTFFQGVMSPQINLAFCVLSRQNLIYYPMGDCLLLLTLLHYFYATLLVVQKNYFLFCFLNGALPYCFLAKLQPLLTTA